MSENQQNLIDDSSTALTRSELIEELRKQNELLRAQEEFYRLKAEISHHRLEEKKNDHGIALYAIEQKRIKDEAAKGDIEETEDSEWPDAPQESDGIRDLRTRTYKDGKWGEWERKNKQVDLEDMIAEVKQEKEEVDGQSI